MSEVEYATLHFYGWWQAITCLFAFLALAAIWWHLGRRKNDYAQIWLALSVLCWSITGFMEVYFAMQLSELSNFESSEAQQLTFRMSGYGSLLSLGNSFFILLSLPWFKHIPERIEPIIKSKYWPYIVGLPFVFSLLPTLSKIFFSGNLEIISELDVYYSILTLAFLGIVLWESFAKRRLKLLAWLSLACILITFIAQVYKISGNEIDMRLFSAIFKSALIMIFFALAMSWVKDLSENILPSSHYFFISLSGTEVMIKGIAGKDKLAFSISHAQSELLQAFLRAKENNDTWLEIKPKGARISKKEYAIKDHNEIKRLTHAILDGIYGKDNWTKEKHEIPFKNQFYETKGRGSRMIRLRLPKENVSWNMA
ncbi:hypothetical protein [Portibacter marinus]|uniref:hypothetical protein n=1 Tax=Portibacter marinus TaxID=2898660 RepID=UPI001F2886D5|nr:hypothetical protein [Portibacter marinus]